MPVNWICKKFDALTPYELYAILQLRSEVFVVEQQCVFLDTDNKDFRCLHMMGFERETLAAYARLAPPGVIYAEASIGRVVTSPLVRKHGWGRMLMHRCIEECYALFGIANIKIGAQLYLKNFYRSFGFEQISEVYDEDGIDHIHMLLRPEGRSY